MTESEKNHRLDEKYKEAIGFYRLQKWDVGIVVEMPLTGALYDAVLPGEVYGTTKRD